MTHAEGECGGIWNGTGRAKDKNRETAQRTKGTKSGRGYGGRHSLITKINIVGWNLE